jgi:mannose-6-phosphate isomerase-like protein (cupin superfamily)
LGSDSLAVSIYKPKIVPEGEEICYSERQMKRGRKPEMAKLIERPSVIEAAGNKPKRIEEYIGRVNSGTAELSVAKMSSPGGWIEPGQRPEFAEYTVVLRGALRVKTETDDLTVWAGQAVHVAAGEWVQYSTPGDDGAEYIAVCLPAFSPGTVHRDE